MALPRFKFSFEHLLVLIALTLSAGAFLRSPSEPPPPPDLQPLRDQLADLRRAVESMAQRAPQSEAIPVPAVSPDGVTVHQLHQWIWDLDQRLAQLDQTRAIPNPLTAPFTDTDHARQVALNFQASPEARLMALRALRATNERTPEVVQAMLNLQASLSDAKLRADIFKQLSGSDSPILKQPLLAALRDDQSPKVREKAAEALLPFINDPSVRTALASAMQNDADEKVQKKALDTIEGHGKH